MCILLIGKALFVELHVHAYRIEHNRSRMHSAGYLGRSEDAPLIPWIRQHVGWLVSRLGSRDEVSSKRSKGNRASCGVLELWTHRYLLLEYIHQHRQVLPCFLIRWLQSKTDGHGHAPEVMRYGGIGALQLLGTMHKWCYSEQRGGQSRWHVTTAAAAAAVMTRLSSPVISLTREMVNYGTTI